MCRVHRWWLLQARLLRLTSPRPASRCCWALTRCWTWAAVQPTCWVTASPLRWLARENALEPWVREASSIQLLIVQSSRHACDWQLQIGQPNRNLTGHRINRTPPKRPRLRVVGGTFNFNLLPRKTRNYLQAKPLKNIHIWTESNPNPEFTRPRWTKCSFRKDCYDFP